uniref:DNA-directed DNA polymerase family A palm domain-containing protein n=1 Tax=Clastoptera arizonana TaxID=38151 RepID=A0A1B6CG48_9HEMI
MKRNKWTPLQQPPSPSSVSCLSPFGEQILQAMCHEIIFNQKNTNMIYQKNIPSLFESNNTTIVKNQTRQNNYISHYFNSHSQNSFLHTNYLTGNPKNTVLSNFATVEDLFNPAKTQCTQDLKGIDVYTSNTEPSPNSSPVMEFNDAVLYSTPYGAVINTIDTFKEPINNSIRSSILNNDTNTSNNSINYSPNVNGLTDTTSSYDVEGISTRKSYANPSLHSNKRGLVKNITFSINDLILSNTLKLNDYNKNKNSFKNQISKTSHTKNHSSHEKPISNRKKENIKTESNKITSYFPIIPSNKSLNSNLAVRESSITNSQVMLSDSNVLSNDKACYNIHNYLSIIEDCKKVQNSSFGINNVSHNNCNFDKKNDLTITDKIFNENEETKFNDNESLSPKGLQNNKFNLIDPVDNDNLSQIASISDLFPDENNPLVLEDNNYNVLKSHMDENIFVQNQCVQNKMHSGQLKEDTETIFNIDKNKIAALSQSKSEDLFLSQKSLNSLDTNEKLQSKDTILNYTTRPENKSNEKCEYLKQNEQLLVKKDVNTTKLNNIRYENLHKRINSDSESHEIFSDDCKVKRLKNDVKKTISNKSVLEFFHKKKKCLLKNNVHKKLNRRNESVMKLENIKVNISKIVESKSNDLEAINKGRSSNTSEIFMETKLFLNKLKDLNSKTFGSVRKKFIPPLIKPLVKQNSPAAPSKGYNMIILNEDSIKLIEKKINSNEIKQMFITVVYREGYTLMNKPSNTTKVSRCNPEAIMIYVDGVFNVEYWYCSVLSKEWSDLEKIRLLMNLLLSSKYTYKKVCYEAQAVLMLILDSFKFENYEEARYWSVLDPMVGCWLLDPDNPPHNFSKAMEILGIDQGLMIVNRKYDVKTQACTILPLLGLMMDSVEKKLESLNLLSLFQDMEMKVLPILAVLECQSICVDKKLLQENAVSLAKRLKELRQEAWKVAGKEFQINSHIQLRHILYEELQLDVKHNIKIKQTAQHGIKSTSEAMLKLLGKVHPLPKIILDFRQIQKLKSTYFDGILQHLNSTGTISSTWEQVGAATGRITSSSPNLQSIPKQPLTIMYDKGKFSTKQKFEHEVDQTKIISPRGVFISRPGYSFLAADFQHIEFRVFAHYTQDHNLLNAFQQSTDIFQTLAIMWLGKCDKEDRDRTKKLVYSLMYGAGLNKVAEYLNLDLEESNQIVNRFLDKLPCLKTLSSRVIEKCRAQGYLQSLSGRLRLFPNISSTNPGLRSYSERQAVNFIIQGSAADICKMAMLNSEEALSNSNLDVKLLMQIHDELVWEVADKDVQLVGEKVKLAMESNNKWGELRVPLPVAISVGKNWSDMMPLN